MRTGTALVSIVALVALSACGDDDEPHAWNDPVEHTRVELRPGFSPHPHLISGSAGGPVSARTSSPECSGQVPEEPQHTLTVTEPFERLHVVAFPEQIGDGTPDECVVYLAIRSADGTIRCDDRELGGNGAMIAGGFDAGEYAIFVGRNRVWAENDPMRFAIRDDGSDYEPPPPEHPSHCDYTIGFSESERFNQDWFWRRRRRR